MDLSSNGQSGQWIQINIFCNQISCDNILINEVLGLLNGLDQSIDFFFYVRYDYPANHVRLRLKTKNDFNFAQLQDSILELKKNNCIWKIDFTKYIKEIEQYAHMKIDHSEYLFYLSSKLTLDFLETQKGITAKFDFALSYAIGFISIFWKNEEIQIKKFIQSFSNEYSDIIINTKEKKKLLGKRYRDVKIDDINNKDLKALKDIFENNVRGDNLYEKYDFAYGHIHMFINRLFNSNQRIYEALMYAFLGKYYKNIR